MMKLEPKQQLMVILSEECGELIQMCQKILRRGCVDLDDKDEDFINVNFICDNMEITRIV